MTDTNHVWNAGKAIRSRRQSCGCHITSRKFELCKEGQGFKKSADSKYSLWRLNQSVEVDPVIVRATQKDFETHKRGYLKHIATGKDWVIG